MYPKNFLLVLLLSTFASVVACNAVAEQNSDEMTNADQMDDAEAAAQTIAEVFSLGGGMATVVHPGNGGSPHVKVDWMENGAKISLSYGRPYLKNRVVGEDVEPMGEQRWRLGADEATTLTTDTDLMLAGNHIPAGEYTLFTQRMENEFHLIVNRETGQSGLDYDPERDFAHIPMTVTELDPPAEQLTLSIENGQLGFEWGQMAASVDLMVH